MKSVVSHLEAAAGSASALTFVGRGVGRGVRVGNVIAFDTEGRRGREGIIVVAETKIDDLAAVRAEVVDRICDAVGVPPRSGPGPGREPAKTSSGKLQAPRCRDQYLDDALAGPAVT